MAVRKRESIEPREGVVISSVRRMRQIRDRVRKREIEMNKELVRQRETMVFVSSDGSETTYKELRDAEANSR